MFARYTKTPFFFRLTTKKVAILTVFLILFFVSGLINIHNVKANYINYAWGLTSPNTGAYGTVTANQISGAIFTMSNDTGGNGVWYINKIMAYLSGNTYIKCVIANYTYGQTNGYILYESTITYITSQGWAEFDFPVSPALNASVSYEIGFISSGTFYQYEVNSNPYTVGAFYDNSNNYNVPINPINQGAVFGNVGLSAYAIYFVMSDTAQSSYGFSYTPNSITGDVFATWGYNSTSSLGLYCYTPISTAITYQGKTYFGGLNTGTGNYSLYSTGLSNNPNIYQSGTYHYVSNSTIGNGTFSFQLSPRTLGYEGIKIVITVNSTYNHFYGNNTGNYIIITHCFKWGADSNGNMPTTPTATPSSLKGTLGTLGINSTDLAIGIYVISIVGLVIGFFYLHNTNIPFAVGLGLIVATILCNILDILGIYTYPIDAVVILSIVGIMVFGRH